MALVVYDRVRETTSVTGTSDAVLLGAVTGFQSFAVVGNGNTCYYTISAQGGSEWEVGIGTYNTTGPTLERTTILSSSNSNNKVVFSAGTKDIFLTYPASTSVNTDRTNTFTEPQVISTNSSTDALRITQTGAGNAILVEDSANPDATPFVVDASGQVGIGTSTPGGMLTITSDTATQVRFQRNTSDASAAQLIYIKQRGTVSSPVSVNSSDGLGATQYFGYDGTTTLQAARFDVSVDGAPATGSMPGRLTFSTTPSGSSIPVERMRIDSVGNVGIGTTSPATTKVIIAGTLPSSGGNSRALSTSYTIPSSSTGQTVSYLSFPSTQAASFTASQIIHFYANQGTIGATSAVTVQYGFIAESNLTGATTNYGFLSSIPSGTGRWNFYANGTADNYMAGSLGIGTTSFAGQNLSIQKTATGATTSQGIFVGCQVQSDVTSTYRAAQATLATAAASFTLTELTGFAAFQGTLGAGSTVTNQYGFSAGSNLTGATNNFGFFSNIASGTGRWNFYANGTADNYFNGSVGAGFFPPAAPGATKVFVGGDISMSGSSRGILGNLYFSSGWKFLANGYGWGIYDFTGDIVFSTAGLNSSGANAAATLAERMRITALGNLLVGTLVNTNSSRIVAAGTISETVGSTQYLVASQYDVGSAPNQIPLNQYLGTMAFQDSNAVTTGLARLGVGTGQEALRAVTTANSVNYLQVSGAITAQTPNIQALGSDTNIGLDIVSKGTGILRFFTGSYGAQQFRVLHTASAVNNLDVTGAAAGSSPVLSASGTDTNINIRLTPKGTGDVLVTTGALGYTTGSGGAVTQTTSRTQGVTLDKSNGSITLVSAAGTTTWQTFTVTNNKVVATDTILVVQRSGTDLYEIHVTAVGAGSFNISFRTTGGTTTEQPVFNFAVIKAVTS